jgi:hypothetical protein
MGADPSERQRHKWSILQIDADEAASATAEANYLDYSNLQIRIDSMLKDSAVMIGRGAEDEAARVVVNSLLRGDTASGNPHLIFVGAGPEPHLMEVLHARGPEVPAVVHILAQTEAWRTDSCKDLSHKTAGTYREIYSYDQISQACVETYSSLLHHYRIDWRDTVGENLELDIRCEDGRASCSYQMAGAPAVPDAISA